MGKSKKAGVEFQWLKSSVQIIADKGFTRDFYKDMGNVFKRHFDKYVPWDSTNHTSAHLAKMVPVRPTKQGATIIYTMPYAKYQYERTDYKHDRSVHRLATHHWDKFCWTNERLAIIKEVNALRKGHAKK